MILNSDTKLLVWLIIALSMLAPIILLPFISLFVRIFRGRKELKARKVKIKEEKENTVSPFLEVFKKDNIEDVQMEMSRITVTCKNIEDVDTKALQDLGADGVLLVGNKIKFTMKVNTKKVYEEIKRK